MSHQRKKNFSNGTFSVDFSEAKERKFESLNFAPKVLNEDADKMPIGYSAWTKDKPTTMDPSGQLIGKNSIGHIHSQSMNNLEY